MSKSYKQFHLDKNRFRELYYFALQYPEWVAKLNEIAPISAVNINGLPSGSGKSDPTAVKAERIDFYKSRIAMIEACAKWAGDYKNETYTGEYKAIMKSVTNENITYNYLRHNGLVHCGRNQFYAARAKFYWILDRRLKEENK